MQSVKRALVRLCQAFLSLVAESRYRRAVRELQALDSRTLADLGITRGEIDFVVRNGHPREWDVDRQVTSEKPHRNPVLGRASTPAEAAYVAKGDFVHKRRPPTASPSLVPTAGDLERAVT